MYVHILVTYSEYRSTLFHINDLTCKMHGRCVSVTGVSGRSLMARKKWILLLLFVGAERGEACISTATTFVALWSRQLRGGKRTNVGKPVKAGETCELLE